MIWKLQYTISNKRLLTIRETGESIGEIKTQRLTYTALAKLRLNASHCGALRQDPVIIRNPRKIDEVVFIPQTQKMCDNLQKNS